MDFVASCCPLEAHNAVREKKLGSQGHQPLKSHNVACTFSANGMETLDPKPSKVSDGQDRDNQVVCLIMSNGVCLELQTVQCKLHETGSYWPSPHKFVVVESQTSRIKEE